MARLATFPETALTRQAVRLDHVEVLEGTAVVEVKIATSVARLAILPATVLKAVRKAAMVVDMVEVTEAEAATEAHDRVRLAIPAAATATCPATVRRARNAITVSAILLWPSKMLLMHYRW